MASSLFYRKRMKDTMVAMIVTYEDTMKSVNNEVIFYKHFLIFVLTQSRFVAITLQHFLLPYIIVI